MCGIFGFSLDHSIPLVKVHKVLEKLEIHQYAGEKKPVGGYGAGLAVLQNGVISCQKVGKVGDESPARKLGEIVNVAEASVLVGHVRMPSPEFMATARFKETAQPYVVNVKRGSTVVSVHNGKVENYKELRRSLGRKHFFESEKVELIDSEVIPHIFAELLNEKQNDDSALHALFDGLEGSSSIAILHVDKENAFLHFLHKGKTRGLTIWNNEQNEVVFGSRKEPIIEVLADIIHRGKFTEKVSIAYKEDTELRLSYRLILR